MEKDFKNTMDELKLVKYLSGELNESEIKEVELWLEVPENKTEFQKLSQLWEGTGDIQHARLFPADKSWNDMKQRMDSLQQKTTKLRSIIILRYAIAASLVLVLGLAFFFFYHQNTNHNLTQYTAGNIKQEKPVILPDGTKVYLNRNTNLTYDKDFNGTTRTVSLTGEAYFDVAKNPSKPFIIRTSSTEIKVVGTSFNVMAYTQSDSVLVAVQSGIVEMYSKADKDARLRLTVGNSGAFVKSNNSLMKHNSFDNNALAWKTNKLNFKNSDLAYVVSALEHAFGKDIQFNPASYKNCKLNANFNNQSLDVILNVIKETLGLNISNNGDVYVISGSGCK
jgi:ferric-dicitrate binding protein FerR (iron transport regulator)